jgi:hypothetical protein
LEELVQEMRARFKGFDATKIEKVRTLAELKCKYAATRLYANELIDFVVISFYGLQPPADLLDSFLLDRRRNGQEKFQAT